MNNFPLPLFILLQWWCCKSNWGLKGGGFWLYPSRGQWEDGLFGYFICTVSIRAHSHFSLWKQVCLFSNIFCPLSFKFRCTLRIIVLHINIIKWYPLWGDFSFFFFCRGKKRPTFFFVVVAGSLHVWNDYCRCRMCGFCCVSLDGQLQPTQSAYQLANSLSHSYLPVMTQPFLCLQRRNWRGCV